MASDAEKLQFRRRQFSVGADDSQKLIVNMPPYPESVKKRFPEMQQHEDQLKEWVKTLILVIRGNIGQGPGVPPTSPPP